MDVGCSLRGKLTMKTILCCEAVIPYMRCIDRQHAMALIEPQQGQVYLQARVRPEAVLNDIDLLQEKVVPCPDCDYLAPPGSLCFGLDVPKKPAHPTGMSAMKRKRCGEVVDVIANLKGVQETGLPNGHGDGWNGRLPLMKNLRLLGVATEDGVFDSKGAQRNPDSTGRFTLATRGAVTVICSKDSLKGCFPGDKIAIANYVGEKSRHSMLPANFRLPTLVKAGRLNNEDERCPESIARQILQAIMKDFASAGGGNERILKYLPNWVDVFYNREFNPDGLDLSGLKTNLTIPVAGSSLWRKDADEILDQYQGGGAGRVVPGRNSPGRVNRIETPADYMTALNIGRDRNITANPGQFTAILVANLQRGDSFDLAFRKAICGLNIQGGLQFTIAARQQNAAQLAAAIQKIETDAELSVKCIGCLLEKLDPQTSGSYAAARILLRPT